MNRVQNYCDSLVIELSGWKAKIYDVVFLEDCENIYQELCLQWEMGQPHFLLQLLTVGKKFANIPSCECIGAWRLSKSLEQ